MQGLMKFEEVPHPPGCVELGRGGVGVSERTFRRWRDRYEAEGAEGLYDRRLGRASVRRALPSMAPGRLTLDARSAVGVTLDDATSEVYFFVAEGAPASGPSTRWRAGCSLYIDSHYFHTPEACGKVDKDNPTQVGCALRQLGCIAACSPEARGRCMFAALQKRLPQELRLAGIAEANRFLEQVYLPGRNARFAIPPEGVGLRALRRRPGRHPLPRSAPSPTTTPCAARDAACNSRPTAATTSRPRSGSPRPHPRLFHGRLARYPSSIGRLAIRERHRSLPFGRFSRHSRKFASRSKRILFGGTPLRYRNSCRLPLLSVDFRRSANGVPLTRSNRDSRSPGFAPGTKRRSNSLSLSMDSPFEANPSAPRSALSSDARCARLPEAVSTPRNRSVLPRPPSGPAPTSTGRFPSVPGRTVPTIRG